MAIDFTNLSQTDLLQLVNATPLGQVLTRSRLRRQMDAAALRIGDGTRIHFVKYVRWLVMEHERPRAAPIDYMEARRRQAEKNRAATKASQDITPIPEVEDRPRRRACAESFQRFCETYFPAAFYRAWSDDHPRVIAKIEKAVREGGLFAFAVPRGSGKTSLCLAASRVGSGLAPFSAISLRQAATLAAFSDLAAAEPCRKKGQSRSEADHADSPSGFPTAPAGPSPRRLPERPGDSSASS